MKVLLEGELKMDKITVLKILANEAETCTKCVLHKERIKSVFSKGNPNAKIVLLGEGPGNDENLQGLPFVGRSGKLLDSMILAMGLTQEDVYVCNVVKCRPPNNRKPLPEEVGACSSFLSKQLNLVNPKVIVTLGASAIEALLGSGLGITKRRGKWEKWKDIPVLPTLHPSYLLRNPAAKIDCAADLKLVLEYLKELNE